MEYFELFNLPISLKVNKAEVLKKYYDLCKVAHPDKHITSSHTQHQTAINYTAKINEAKKILENTDLRLEYLLQQKEAIQKDEKYTLSPLFLAEMMELNEVWMDAKMEENEIAMKSIKQQAVQRMNEVDDEVKEYLEADILICNDIILQKLKEYYYQKKYINRLISSMTIE